MATKTDNNKADTFLKRINDKCIIEKTFDGYTAEFSTGTIIKVSARKSENKTPEYSLESVGNVYGSERFINCTNMRKRKIYVALAIQMIENN